MRIALKSIHGKYGSVQPDGTVIFDRDEIGAWETIEVVELEPTPPQPPQPPGGHEEPREDNTPAPPDGNPLALRGDFLTLRDARDKPVFSHVLSGRSPEIRQLAYDACHARGYTDLALYIYNEDDYATGVTFDFYADPAGFAAILQEVVTAGLRPNVWLAPDDAPRFHRNSAKRLPEMWRRVIPQIDAWVGSYVVGLEMEEYWTKAEQLRLCQVLTGLTDKPVFVHFKGGNWGGHAFWGSKEMAKVSGLIYQYDRDKADPSNDERDDLDHFARRTRDVANALMRKYRKVLIAGEYAVPPELHGNDGVSEEYAITRGALALKHGAIGFLNGGPRA